MTALIISVPKRSTELDWICSVIFTQYLGLNYVIDSTENTDFSISFELKKIEMPNIFFSMASAVWLEKASLPIGPLPLWHSKSSTLEPNLLDPSIPIIYGTNNRVSAVTSDYIFLPIDIFGSAFFMLSRYEEAVNIDRDIHDRFPVTASLAYREGFLNRPLVDEYIEILWSALNHLWPNLQRKNRLARTLVSCDVDSPFDPACASLYRLGKRLVGRTLREKSLSSVPEIVRSYREVSRGNYSYDPFRSAIDWIMDVNEKENNRVAFYFIPEITDRKIDNGVSLTDPRMRALLRSIHIRQHEIGIHPGYNTYKNPDAFAHSTNTLRRVMNEEGIKQDILGGRQHYLRWETTTTAQLWDTNGLTYDTTLTYADCPGFRCGTCHEYPMYDLKNRRSLKVLQRPLVMMEGERYVALKNKGDALELMQYYKKICHQFSGDFTLLWHNSFFEAEATKKVYCEIIRNVDIECRHPTLVSQLIK